MKKKKKIKRAQIHPLLDAPEFRMLRQIQRAFSSGGVPAPSIRTLEDEARIAAYFTLQQLMYMLRRFEKENARGEPVHLLVDERGQSPDRVLVSIVVVRIGKGRP